MNDKPEGQNQSSGSLKLIGGLISLILIAGGLLSCTSPLPEIRMVPAELSNVISMDQCKWEGRTKVECVISSKNGNSIPKNIMYSVSKDKNGVKIATWDIPRNTIPANESSWETIAILNKKAELIEIHWR